MEQNKPTILNFSQISLESESYLQQLVQMNRQILTILVHPFYREHMESDFLDGTLQYAHSNRERNLIEGSSSVVIILEGENNMDSTKLRILTLNSQATVILIKTINNDNPEPAISWPSFIKKLHQLDVRKVLIGGREFYYRQDGEIGGCVPIARVSLQESFETSYLPNLCYPDNP